MRRIVAGCATAAPPPPGPRPRPIATARGHGEAMATARGRSAWWSSLMVRLSGLPLFSRGASGAAPLVAIRLPHGPQRCRAAVRCLVTVVERLVTPRRTEGGPVARAGRVRPAEMRPAQVLGLLPAGQTGREDIPGGRRGADPPAAGTAASTTARAYGLLAWLDIP
jgi:hypothetical protein